MILYELKCQDGHGFEAWFRDGATYDAQASAGEIACPVCGNTGIVKAPMAPRIAKRPIGDRAVEQRPDTAPSGPEASTMMVSGEIRARLEALRRHVEENCDSVGDDFAEEARRIHYGEVPHRDIYGEATEDEAAELADEGVAFARIPWPARTDS